jgi:serine/threonine-protein kinase
VLHRDLKPANITVTPEGQVKILDFGLAKALGPAVAGSEPMPSDRSATITSPAFTQAGVILGTAAYMSPEQVRGKPVDRRADIWAFGCVLYEMLTGTRAFQGETASDTLASVLKSAPDWTKLPRDVPGPVHQLLAHCLQQNPRARLRDIADARLLLQTFPTSAAAPPAIRPRARSWVAGVIGSVLTVAVLAGGWYSVRPDPSSTVAPVRRVTVQLPVALPSSTSGGGPALAIAPDGGAVAFTGRSRGQNQLFVHRLADATTVTVHGSANPTSPAFSPDGEWLVYGLAGGDTRIWRANALGGEPDSVCAAPAGFGGGRGASWGDDGRAVFASQAGLIEVSSSGGPCVVSRSFEGEREARFLWPQILPGGRGTLLTVSGVSDDADRASVVVVPAGTTERRVIVPGARAGRLTRSGHLLFARGHQIFAAPFDLDRLAITAEPVVVVDGVASGQFGGPLMDVSASGDLVYVPGRNPGNRLVG